jgi:3-isopropylmalate/(R)-2-methylmalate dehydratase small subunit
MKGKVIKYDIKNVNTDAIIPARYLVSSEPEHLAQHCMEDIDPNFILKVKKHEYSILVTNSNFGCGSSREQAPISLKTAGIRCIIAPSFARIFLRNSINIGLPILELERINLFNIGDDLNIDLITGLIENLTTKMIIRVKKTPEFIQDIINANGLINYARRFLISKE